MMFFELKILNLYLKTLSSTQNLVLIIYKLLLLYLKFNYFNIGIYNIQFQYSIPIFNPNIQLFQYWDLYYKLIHILIFY